MAALTISDSVPASQEHSRIAWRQSPPVRWGQRGLGIRASVTRPDSSSLPHRGRLGAEGHACPRERRERSGSASRRFPAARWQGRARFAPTPPSHPTQPCGRSVPSSEGTALSIHRVPGADETTSSHEYAEASSPPSSAWRVECPRRGVPRLYGRTSGTSVIRRRLPCPRSNSRRRLRRTGRACQAGGFGRARNRSRLSPSMMSAVSPASDFISWSSPSCKKTASPAPIGSSTPFAPLTSPDPSSTARICGCVPGCRLIRPPGSNRKIAAPTSAPSSNGCVAEPWKHDRVDRRAARTPLLAQSSSVPRAPPVLSSGGASISGVEASGRQLGWASVRKSRPSGTGDVGSDLR